MPEAEVRVAELKAFETKSGNTRFVLVDDQGKEYSTFKEQIAAKLPGLTGKKVRIMYREQQREGFTNLDLDDVELLDPADPAGERETDEREISPRDLFAKLQPFKELVAEDLEQDGEG